MESTIKIKVLSSLPTKKMCLACDIRKNTFAFMTEWRGSFKRGKGLEMGETERYDADRHNKTETNRETDRQTDRQTGRQAGRQAGRQRQGLRDRDREIETQTETYRQTDRQTAQRQTGVATFRSTPGFNGRTFVSPGLSTEGTTVSASAELCWGRQTDTETQTSEGKVMYNA